MAEPADHDQLFKTVIREFFPDFLTLFFPEQAARFDLARVRWLDKEVFADPPDGPRHVLDMVAELPKLGATDETSLALVDVDVEIESADSVTDIERRLPAYYVYLRRTSGKPVLPVVLYLKVGLDGVGVRDILDPPDGEPILTLRYCYVGLPALSAAEYVVGQSWLGVALSALMKAPKDARLGLGVEAMRRLGDAPLPDGRKALLGDCVETYIELPEAELARFRDIIEANATGRVTPVNKTRVQIAEERGVEKGMVVGIEEGRLRTLRAAVTELLEAKFGPMPSELADRVTATTDLDVLRRLLIAAGTSATLDQFRASAGW